MRKNSATLSLNDIPHPPAATFVGDWCDLETAHPTRYFRAQDWVVSDGRFEILVDGTQMYDGTVIERDISLSENERERLNQMTADDARAIGQALIEAADAVDAAVKQ